MRDSKYFLQKEDHLKAIETINDVGELEEYISKNNL